MALSPLVFILKDFPGCDNISRTFKAGANCVNSTITLMLDI